MDSEVCTCCILYFFFPRTAHTLSPAFQRVIQVRLESLWWTKILSFQSVFVWFYPAGNFTGTYCDLSVHLCLRKRESGRFMHFVVDRARDTRVYVGCFSFAAKIGCDISLMSEARKANSITGEFPPFACTDSTAPLLFSLWLKKKKNTWKSARHPRASTNLHKNMISTLSRVDTRTAKLLVAVLLKILIHISSTHAFTVTIISFWATLLAFNAAFLISSKANLYYNAVLSLFNAQFNL